MKLIHINDNGSTIKKDFHIHRDDEYVYKSFCWKMNKWSNSWIYITGLIQLYDQTLYRLGKIMCFLEINSFKVFFRIVL